MRNQIISDSIQYIGVNDQTIDLFESQYPVPNGVSYNSYCILDEKIAVMDTVDHRMSMEWLEQLDAVLQGKTPDFLVISHLEPDHAGTIAEFVAQYSKVTLVGNAKTFAMLPNFFAFDCNAQKKFVVAEGDILELGNHTLQFFMAPMVHWPEVMVEYEQREQILFSADGFGTFGVRSPEEPWEEEARRYYYNIVGKYGAPVQTLLKKAAKLEISMICPLHGPVLKENLGYYIGKYQTWSTYQPEEHGVLIAYASIHGNTAKAAEKLADLLLQEGETVAVADLAREDQAAVVADAFRYDRMVLAAASYDGGVFPPMETFLMHLKAKTFRNRTVALIENASWAPSAKKVMTAYLNEMKNITILEPSVTIRSALKPETEQQLQTLADAIRKA